MPSLKASKNPVDKLSKAEKTAIKTALKSKFGLKQADVDAVLTTADENNAALDAKAVEAKLTAYCRTLKK